MRPEKKDKVAIKTIREFHAKCTVCKINSAILLLMLAQKYSEMVKSVREAYRTVSGYPVSAALLYLAKNGSLALLVPLGILNNLKLDSRGAFLQ